jgi:heme o synthase
MTQAAGTLRGHGTGTVYTPEGGRRSALLVAKSLFVLTKPRIIELLLVTTLPTMLLAQRGLPPARLMAATLTGGALAAASANTLNCFIDRDIDAMMRRTSRRPLAATGAKKVIRPGEALVSGIVLGAASTVLPGLLVNWLAAALAAPGEAPRLPPVAFSGLAAVAGLARIRGRGLLGDVLAG